MTAWKTLPFKLSTVVRGRRKKPLFQIFKERETTPCGRLFHRLTEKRRFFESGLKSFGFGFQIPRSDILKILYQICILQRDHYRPPTHYLP